MQKGATVKMVSNNQLSLQEIMGDLAQRLHIPEQMKLEVCQTSSVDGFHITRKKDTVKIEYACRSYLFRAMGLLAENIGKENYEISQMPAFHANGLMLDCSRNAVPKDSTIKDLIVKMALMGHTTLMLYTEDTYEIEGQPYFGYMRGRYSLEEFKELDMFAAAYGIELIPCIQTLAHLSGILQWSAYQNLSDCNDILLADNDDTYALIEEMIKTCRKAFQSRQINIGMDEAWMLGRGKYRDIHGNTDSFDIMCRHLKRVLEICKKYDFHPMMWSDMFFHLITGSFYGDQVKLTKEQQEKIPDDIALIYWDYYSKEQQTYENRLNLQTALERENVFAGGAWKWSGYAPSLYHSMRVSKLALNACKGKLDKVFVTAWGDDGGEASQYSILPVLQLFAEYSFNSEISDYELQKRFQTCTGGKMEDFLCLDLPNLPEKGPSDPSVNPCKYLLFQDILLGLFDKHVSAEYPAYYKETSAKLHACADRNPGYGYMFETLAELCDLLAVKCDIGIRLKAAYDAGDKESLRRCAQEDLEEIVLHANQFKAKLGQQWMRENKPFGYEVQDVRISGVAARAESAAKRLLDYADGKLGRLEELEQERLYFDCRMEENKKLGICCNQWTRIISANIV